MLPIVLVLLVASSAFSFPTVEVVQYPIQDSVSLKDPGRPMSRYVSMGIYDLFDGGEKDVYSMTLEQVVDDIADLQDRYSQALAFAQVLGTMGEIAYGVPGDSCLAAAAINEAVSEVSTGQAMAAWKAHLASNIDAIINLATNPDLNRYRVGTLGRCAGGGRTYQFEAAWNIIRSTSNPFNYGLLSEAQCSARRLYNAMDVRDNNIAAAFTASSLPPVVNVMNANLGAFTNLFKLILSGASPSRVASAAGVCKTILLG